MDTCEIPRTVLSEKPPLTNCQEVVKLKFHCCSPNSLSFPQFLLFFIHSVNNHFTLESIQRDKHISNNHII